MKNSRWGWIFFFLIWGAVRLSAQEYSGITGLIHTPSAEMNPAGMARIGVFYLNKAFLPHDMSYGLNGSIHKYPSTNHFVAIAPFDWLELAYTCTLLKRVKDGKPRYYQKDRNISFKVRVLKEGKWWPAVALGSHDPYHFSSKATPDYFSDYYGAAVKHFDWHGHELGVNVAYRWYKEPTNRKWQGLTCGLTYRPAFARNFRGIIEYTGNDINIGMDCYLWKLLFLQASLQNGKAFTGGVMLQIQL